MENTRTDEMPQSEKAKTSAVITTQPTRPSNSVQNRLLDNNDVDVAISPRVKGNDTVIYLCSFCIVTVTYK